MLRLATEEAVARRKGEGGGGGGVTNADKSGVSATGSRKRKRGGELVEGVSVEAETYDVAEAIYEVLDVIVRLGTPEGCPVDDAFAAEYMKSVTRLSGEESAKLLGSWLDLCRLTRGDGDEAQRSAWLLPFIETWKTRMDGGDDSLLFSTHCLQPLLGLCSSPDLLHEWRTQLEQVLSRSILVPARNAYSDSKTTEYLASLVTNAVAARPDFAPLLFEVAILMLRPTNTNRFRTQDAEWLQAVFRALTDACPAEPWRAKNQAVNKMMEMCLENKIPLDLDLLKSITAQCGFHDDQMDGDLIATVVTLNGHVFTIADEHGDSLNELFSRITSSSMLPGWPGLADTYVDRILVPLMESFAKARDLTGFIHRWHEQLVAFDTLIADSPPRKEPAHFSAWEDDVLLTKLRELMEATLTSEQIKDIFVWIRDQADHPGPALVIMDAVTGALSREESIDATALHVWISDWVTAQQNVLGRYKHRQARALTHTMDITAPEVLRDELSKQVDTLGLLSGNGTEFSPASSHVDFFTNAASKYTLLSTLDKDVAAENLVLSVREKLHAYIEDEAIPWFASSGKGEKKKKKEEPERRSIAVKLQIPDVLYGLAKTILVDYPKCIKYVLFGTAQHIT